MSPSVLIVAVNCKDDDPGPRIVVEPEDHEFQPTLFKDVLSFSAQLEHINPGPLLAYQGDAASGASWIDREKRAAFQSRIRSAIETVIREASPNYPRRAYVSLGRDYGTYLIHTVLLVSEAEYIANPRLHRLVHDQFTVEPSLIDAVAHRFVEEAHDAILSSFAGRGFGGFPTTDAILRDSGVSLMYTPSSACASRDGHDNLFSACSEISTLTYEKSSERGRLIFARRNHDAISETMTFHRPVRLSNSRAIRKLLQLTNDNEGLLCNSSYARGIGAIQDNYNPMDEDIFCVNFISQSKWELVHGGTPLMRVEHGIPQLPEKKMQVRQFNETLCRLFPETTEKQRSHLSQIAGSADDLGNGAVLIITSRAAEEAARFGEQATVIEPHTLTVEFLGRASRIDGAILASPDGQCHAIGVILDGLVNRKGTSERGARYNSTVRYVLGSDCPCLGVIVSDDGMVDLIPEYHPRISRQDVERAVEELRESASQIPVNEKMRAKAISQLKRLAFYLNESHCEEVNRLRNLNQSPLEIGEVRIDESSFSPNADMNESFFVT